MTHPTVVPPPPRLFGIPAARAPIVAVFRRGPSDWSHVGRWDVASGVYDPGAWIRGTLYPQRCDLSPDGRWLSYFALKASARWAVGGTYVAVSRLPWLTALAAWATCGTWTRGYHFVEDRGVWSVGAPSAGDVGTLRRRFGMTWIPAVTFAVERRRGWTETAGTPARSPHDAWDEQRSLHVTMEKRQPASSVDVRLTVRGHYAAFRSSLPHEAKDIEYAIVARGRRRPLDDAQWADWTAEGRLLIATRAGRLQIREGASFDRITFDVDLAAMSPTPLPPPAAASAW